jgi:NAD(P)-dependent dehydrogenase (short-subunit alcohol dehydrogenase family)
MYPRLNKVEKSAGELSSTTGQKCGFASADVRDTAKLKEAVEKCVAQFGKIDFVICGKCAVGLLSSFAIRSPTCCFRLATPNNLKQGSH